MVSEATYTDEERGLGWITFAGIMMMISGSVTFIQGLWALDHKTTRRPRHRRASSVTATSRRGVGSP